MPLTGTALEERRRVDLARALTIARWSDSRFLDPLVGFVLPGLGDVLGAAAGLYIVALAVRHGAPRSVVARMIMNLSIDCLGGVVPVVGDLFDVLNRANLRNARLLQRHLTEARPDPPARRAGSLAGSIAVLVVAIVAALGSAYYLATQWTR